MSKMMLVKPSDLDRRLAAQWAASSMKDRENISLGMRRRYESAVSICRAWDRLKTLHHKAEIAEIDEKPDEDAILGKSLNDIASAVCRVTKVSTGDLRGFSRKRFIIPARKIFCSIAVDSRGNGPSLTQVGLYLNRDHTTVLYSVIAVANDEKLLLLAKSVISAHLPMEMHHRLDANVSKYAGKSLDAQRCRSS